MGSDPANVVLSTERRSNLIDVYVIPLISKRLKLLYFNFSVDFLSEAGHQLRGFGWLTDLTEVARLSYL